MRFLLDQNQSPLLATLLNGAGHDSVHTRNIGLSRALDPVVMETAKSEGRVLISADTDFGELLSRSGDTSPSVLLLRRHDRRRVGALATLILANLEVVEDDLNAGALVVLDQGRVRVRRLPIFPQR